METGPRSRCFCLNPDLASSVHAPLGQVPHPSLQPREGARRASNWDICQKTQDSVVWARLAFAEVSAPERGCHQGRLHWAVFLNWPPEDVWHCLETVLGVPGWQVGGGCVTGICCMEARGSLNVLQFTGQPDSRESRGPKAL